MIEVRGESVGGRGGSRCGRGGGVESGGGNEGGGLESGGYAAGGGCLMAGGGYCRIMAGGGYFRMSCAAVSGKYCIGGRCIG